VICCVRDVNWIMDSIERLVRRNAFEPSGMFGYESGGTVFSRIMAVASSEGLVGYALDALKDGFFGEQANAMILVEYDALVINPRRTLEAIYQFIGEPWFEHDFDNVVYDADEFDLALGAPGLHTIRRKVEFIPRQTVLPPQLFHRFDDDMFWRVPGANRNNVRIISRP
jgi:sulfotransferase